MVMNLGSGITHHRKTTFAGASSWLRRKARAMARRRAFFNRERIAAEPVVAPIRAAKKRTPTRHATKTRKKKAA